MRRNDTNFAEIIADLERQKQEWHDACATCGAKYQGIGPVCSPCHQNEIDALLLEEHKARIGSELLGARQSLPPWRNWATFSKLEKHPAIDRRILEAARSWNYKAGSLVLIGPTGVGKSACAHAIADRILAAAMATPLNLEWDKQTARRIGSNMLWVAGSKLALARKQSRLGDGEAFEVREAIDASLLFIDELGYEQVVGDGAVFDVVNKRYEKGCATVVTSGRTESELVDRYGAAFMRRLREPGTVVDVHSRNAPALQAVSR